MAKFETAYEIVKGHEGGYANNPLDRGGETYKGIARKIWPSWGGWIVIEVLKRDKSFPANCEADKTLQRHVLTFFKVNFWDVLSLDQVTDQAIANELFDTAVNMGTGMAGRFLQRVLNATNNRGKAYPNIIVDGKIGPATVQTLNKHQSPKQILKLLNCLQGAYYMQIVEKDESQEVFMNSWCSRVAI